MTAKGNKYQPHRRPEWTLLLYNNNVMLDTRDRRSSLGIPGQFKDVGRLVQTLRYIRKGSGLGQASSFSPEPFFIAHNPGPLHRVRGRNKRRSSVLLCANTNT